MSAAALAATAEDEGPRRGLVPSRYLKRHPACVDVLRRRMDDYSALAQRVAVTVGDVRGCLCSPGRLWCSAPIPRSESAIKPAWLRFATLGEPQKSFVEFGDQIWAYVHRGPYAAFIVAGTTVRPGVLIDQMEQALLTAEDARTRREPLKLPDASVAPSGKPRTSLHPPAERQQPAEVVAAPQEERRHWARAAPPEAEGGADRPVGRSRRRRRRSGRTGYPEPRLPRPAAPVRPVGCRVPGGARAARVGPPP